MDTLRIYVIFFLKLNRLYCIKYQYLFYFIFVLKNYISVFKIMNISIKIF